MTPLDNETRILELEQENAKLRQEIDDRKLLGESLQVYEHIVSSPQYPKSFVDKNYVYRAVNSAFCEFFGKQRGDVVGRNVAYILGEEMFQGVAKDYLDKSFAGEQVCYDTWFEYSERGRRYMNVHYYPFVDDEGVALGTVVSCHGAGGGRAVG